MVWLSSARFPVERGVAADERAGAQGGAPRVSPCGDRLRRRVRQRSRGARV